MIPPSTAVSVELIAQHFGAHSTGTGRWIARCPVHPDKSPSLSIAAGRNGKVLVRCWVGCDLKTVLKSAGLSMSSLFPSGPPPAPEQRARLERKRERQLIAKQEERYTIEKMRSLWQSLSYELPLVARKLMVMPEGTPGAAALTTHFHRVLTAMRTIDCALLGDLD
jgi:hypothetical protein